MEPAPAALAVVQGSFPEEESIRLFLAETQRAAPKRGSLPGGQGREAESCQELVPLGVGVLPSQGTQRLSWIFLMANFSASAQLGQVFLWCKFTCNPISRRHQNRRRPDPLKVNAPLQRELVKSELAESQGLFIIIHNCIIKERE